MNLGTSQSSLTRELRRALGGFGAGVIATIPMTLAMMLMHRFLKASERYPLPPRTITARLLGRTRSNAFTRHGLDTSDLNALTVSSHFGYGGACGLLFVMVERVLPAPRIAKGLVFGIAVWAGSYLAWLPALGILSPATSHPPRRTALMIVAHLIWGASLGLIFSRLSPTETPSHD